MPTYVMLSRLSTEAIKNPNSFNEISHEVIQRLDEECPEVKSVTSYSVLGRYDYIDIFEAPSNDSATKVAVVIRSFGHATTEIWPATTFERFKQIVEQTSHEHEDNARTAETKSNVLRIAS